MLCEADGPDSPRSRQSQEGDAASRQGRSRSRARDQGGGPSGAARGADRLRRADALDRGPAGLGPCRALDLAQARGGRAVDGAGGFPPAQRRGAARRGPLRRQDEIRPRPRHRHRRGPYRFRLAARARRRGGHRHADPGQGDRAVDGRNLFDVRPWKGRHHARPRPRPGGCRTAPEEIAQAADTRAPAQDRRAVAPLAQCRGPPALALSPQHAGLERQRAQAGTQESGQKSAKRERKEMTKLEGPSHGPQAGGKPGHLVVLLHGYGADGNDLIGLAPVLAPLMPDVLFLAPNAPYPCDGNPMGFQWFPINRLDPASRLAGTRSAAPFIDTYLDETMAKYGLDETRTALVGFSQGTMMALHVGLRRARQLAGIVGFSGALSGADELKTEIKTRPPILLAHGDADEMLPHTLTEQAATALRENGVDVAVHIAPGVGHGIDQSALSHAARFLLQVFGLRVPQ